MKRIIIFLAVASILVTAVPASALFNNGGFENGDFSGWTLQYGNVTANTASPVWGVTPYGTVTPTIVTTATFPDSYQTTDVNPYNGTYMAKINDIFGDYHATRISQEATIASGDIGNTLYVNWGAMLVDPGHPIIDQPYFSISVLQNGSVVDSFSANATNAATPGSGWTIAGHDQYGDNLWYKANQYTYNLGAFSVGDTIKIDMFVSDCGQSAHGAYAFLDGIGTDYVTPPGVPEPSTIILLGIGTAGLAFWRRSRQNK